MKMLRNWSLPSGFALIALVFLLQLTPALADHNPNPGVLPPNSQPFGKPMDSGTPAGGSGPSPCQHQRTQRWPPMVR